MKKRTWALLVAGAAILITASLLLAAGEITRANWGAAVGFATDKNPPGFVAGETISAANVAKVEKLLPSGIALLVKKYNLKLITKNYEPFAPSNTFIAATNKYKGQVKVVDVGNNPRKKGLSNYNAGLPFPAPANGLEVAYNYIYSYIGDDAMNEFGVYWISGKRGKL